MIEYEKLTKEQLLEHVQAYAESIHSLGNECFYWRCFAHRLRLPGPDGKVPHARGIRPGLRYRILGWMASGHLVLRSAKG